MSLAKRKKPSSGDKVQALCPFKRKGATDNMIQKGEECDFISPAGVDMWRVKRGVHASPTRVNGHASPLKNHVTSPGAGGMVTEAPSCIFTTMPPDVECVNEAQK